MNPYTVSEICLCICTMWIFHVFQRWSAVLTQSCSLLEHQLQEEKMRSSLHPIEPGIGGSVRFTSSSRTKQKQFRLTPALSKAHQNQSECTQKRKRPRSTPAEYSTVVGRAPHCLISSHLASTKKHCKITITHAPGDTCQTVFSFSDPSRSIPTPRKNGHCGGTAARFAKIVLKRRRPVAATAVDTLFHFSNCVRVLYK